jgi:hypothetical protein
LRAPLTAPEPRSLEQIEADALTDVVRYFPRYRFHTFLVSDLVHWHAKYQQHVWTPGAIRAARRNRVTDHDAECLTARLKVYVDTFPVTNLADRVVVLESEPVIDAAPVIEARGGLPPLNTGDGDAPIDMPRHVRTIEDGTSEPSEPCDGPGGEETAVEDNDPDDWRS